MTEVRMPRLGDTMDEGELESFDVADGGLVEEGATVCTVTSDKVTFEVPAPSAGVVRHVAEPGGTYEVGALLARIERA